jgi:HNH endonuclease
MSKRPPLPANIRKRVLERDEHKCCKCGRPDALHIHHLLAVMDGGTDDDDNLKTLCKPCHREWHVVESVSHMSFDRWIEYPPVHRLITAMSCITSTDDAFEFVQVVKRVGRNFDLIKDSGFMHD